MSRIKLIADSGATKAEWCLLHNGKQKKITTLGISPYFLGKKEVEDLVRGKLIPKLKGAIVDELHYYGTGCSNKENVAMLKQVFKKCFPGATVNLNSDLLAAAKAVCGNEKGIACILGTGSNSCYYDGKKIVRNSPGLGYVLGDEGSGAYLGKKVVQYYLYKTFDEDLRLSFETMFTDNPYDILDKVYKHPLPNRYLASFTTFLSQHRGHYMIENILEDGLNDFFFTHLCKYKEVWKYPINFCGSIAYVFKDVLIQLCNSYEFDMGKIIRKPMDGLVPYHQ